MCTLVVAVGMYPGAVLFVAANRDERLDRASSGPMVWPGPPRFVAPRDEVAGGTWLGLNEHGVFVGVTNRAGAPPDPTRRSRGALVLDALRATSASDAHRRLASLAGDAHNPFHLVYADRRSAHLTWSEGTRLHQADLGAGLHIVTERSPGLDGDTPRATRIRAAWAELGTPQQGPPPIAQVKALLAHHDADRPLDATCVHADAVGYGTRSSMLLAFGEAVHDVRLHWAEGKPCTTPWSDLSELAQSLFA